MGYPVQQSAPTVTVQGRTFAVGAFDWATPVGSFQKVGVYERMPNGDWNEVQSIATYNNSGDMIKDVQAKGGGVKYILWIIDAVNAIFAKLFGASTPAPTTEPTTDTEAMIYVQAGLATRSFTLVNGVPVIN